MINEWSKYSYGILILVLRNHVAGNKETAIFWKNFNNSKLVSQLPDNMEFRTEIFNPKWVDSSMLASGVFIKI